jgi:uncharacterized protein (DUF169 family)
MNSVIKVAEGAFYVPSYYEQTVVSYQPGITTQAVFTGIEETEVSVYIPAEKGEDYYEKTIEKKIELTKPKKE